MSIASTRTSFTVALGALLAGAVGPAACGGSGAGAGTDAADGAATQCPATVAKTLGASCNVPGLLCGPSYSCALTMVPLVCKCAGGSFQCSDGSGRLVQPGEPLPCAAPLDAGTCPLSEALAALAPCDDPALSCPYPSTTCSGGADTCQCLPGDLGDGGVGLSFQCVAAACAGEGGSGSDAEGGDTGALELEGSADTPDAPIDATQADAESGPDATEPDSGSEPAD